MKAKDILKSKGSEVFTISESKPMVSAMEVLVNNNIGVLLVIDTKAKITGIISERDILRAIHQYPDNFSNLLVNDFMTKRIIYADFEDDMDYIENIMTSNRIRHLPILSNKTLVGLISIGDVIKANLSDQRFENKYLIDYIGGNVK